MTQLNNMKKREFYNKHLKGKYFSVLNGADFEALKNLASNLGIPLYAINDICTFDRLVLYAAENNDLHSVGKVASTWLVIGIYDTEVNGTSESPNPLPKPTMFLGKSYEANPDIFEEITRQSSVHFNIFKWEEDETVSGNLNTIYRSDCLAILAPRDFYLNKIIGKGLLAEIEKFLSNPEHTKDSVIIFVENKKGVEMFRLDEIYKFQDTSDYKKVASLTIKPVKE